MYFKTRTLFFILIFYISLVACSTPAELEGTWIGYETGSPQQGWILTIERNQFTLICEDSSTWYKGHLRLNNNCSRNKMDLRISATAVQTDNGKTAFGIYEIEEGTLVLVTGEPGSIERPYSFDEAAETLAFVFEKSTADQASH